MVKRKLTFRPFNLHVLALFSASIILGCAFILGPTAPAEATRISITVPVSSTFETSPTPQNPSPGTLIAYPKNLSHGTPPETVVLSSDSSSTATDMPEKVLPEAESFEAEPFIKWENFTVKPGDSLYKIFSKAGLKPQQLAAMTSSIKDKAWTQLFPGEQLQFGFLDQKLDSLKIHRSHLEKWHIKEAENGKFELSKETITPDIKITFAEGIIESSLFLDGKKAGITNSMIMELANIFGWDIDFILDIRKGDSFKLVYEEKYLEGEHIGNGNILSAQFINYGRTFTAVRYEDSNGRISYYTPEGDSMKKAFRRSPLAFARVSSHFNMRRKHPVMHKIRAHKGTDYAADRGTPIKSTGDGKVIFAGRKGGYGKVVIIQHGQGISTLYAHMKRYARGIRTGKRVSQGQAIGYVGSTGMATGPHLHYEFRVNGVHKNPVTVKLPKAHPIASKEMKRFQKHAETAIAKLESYADSIQVAQSESAKTTREL